MSRLRLNTITLSDSDRFCSASPVPFHKDHLHTLVKAALRTRNFDDMDFDAETVQLPPVDDSDVSLSLSLSVVVCVFSVTLTQPCY